MGKRKVGLFICLGAGLAASLVLSLVFGGAAIDLRAALRDGARSADGRIFLYVRLPRTLAAFLAGVALSASGCIIQGVLRNPLAGPNIVGVNAGAGFAALLTSCVWPGLAGITPLAAFAGALGASLLIFALAAKAGAGRLTVILAGVAINYILSAGMDAVKLLFPDAANMAAYSMNGGFSAVSVRALKAACWYIPPALALAILGAGWLNVLSLGDETAETLGMNIKVTRMALLAVAAILAGAAVSFAGLLGFVGLVAPHAARRIAGEDHRLLLPCAMCLGGAFVPLCDLIGRVAFAPYELPAGLVLAIVGGPFFLRLAVRGRKARFI